FVAASAGTDGRTRRPTCGATAESAGGDGRRAAAGSGRSRGGRRRGGGGARADPAKLRTRYTPEAAARTRGQAWTANAATAASSAPRPASRASPAGPPPVRD